MAKKTLELETILGNYILAVLTSDTKLKDEFGKKVLEAASSPMQVKKFAQAAKNIQYSGAFPPEKADIIREICQTPSVSKQLEAASRDSDVVAGLWLKWCKPMTEDRSSDQNADQKKVEAEKRAIEADLQKARTKISRLEKENSSIEMEAGKDKLVSIISSIVPAVNELAMFIPAMQQAGIEPDAMAGYAAALQTILAAITDAGATMIDSIGEIVEFDPVRHYCMKHIAKGHPVIVESVGFMVDQDVVIPALVKELED